MSYGFTSIGDDKSPVAISIFCGTLLANGSLTPARLQRHMDTKHRAYKNKDTCFFESKLESFGTT